MCTHRELAVVGAVAALLASAPSSGAGGGEPAAKWLESYAGPLKLMFLFENGQPYSDSREREEPHRFYPLDRPAVVSVTLINRLHDPIVISGPNGTVTSTEDIFAVTIEREGARYQPADLFTLASSHRRTGAADSVTLVPPRLMTLDMTLREGVAPGQYRITAALRPVDGLAAMRLPPPVKMIVDIRDAYDTAAAEITSIVRMMHRGYGVPEPRPHFFEWAVSRLQELDRTNYHTRYYTIHRLVNLGKFREALAEANAALEERRGKIYSGMRAEQEKLENYASELERVVAEIPEGAEAIGVFVGEPFKARLFYQIVRK
ncbi:MAG: hypothetical protein HYV63_22930 [Candidatus Schekmanbacteria bacterium]|nr:hypothetical protein [Candidatus Schekmanbacteria bacterium]